MANKIDSVNCGDGFTDAATVGPVWASNGGYFAVASNDVFAQLGVQQGRVRDVVWGPEVHVPTGNGVLYPDTVAVRFRNYVAGQVAVVSSALFSKSEATLVIAAGGVASTVSAVNGLVGKISAAGGILAGTGFSVAKGTAGSYTINFTTPLAAAPAVVATCQRAARIIEADTITASSFNVFISDLATTGQNTAFDFVAIVPQ